MAIVKAMKSVKAIGRRMMAISIGLASRAFEGQVHRLDSLNAHKRRDGRESITRLRWPALGLMAPFLGRANCDCLEHVGRQRRRKKRSKNKKKQETHLKEKD